VATRKTNGGTIKIMMILEKQDTAKCVFGNYSNKSKPDSGEN
jgi:hypothetical protein